MFPPPEPESRSRTLAVNSPAAVNMQSTRARDDSESRGSGQEHRQTLRAARPDRIRHGNGWIPPPGRPAPKGRRARSATRPRMRIGTRVATRDPFLKLLIIASRGTRILARLQWDGWCSFWVGTVSLVRLLRGPVRLRGSNTRF